MDFRLTVPIAPAPSQIEPTHHGVVLGSCFATHIGGWLADGKMPVCVNPFGVLYNPVSLAQAWERLETAEPFTRADLFEHNGLWHSFAHHGDFSGSDPEAVLEGMNRALQAGHEALQRADYILVTLGTSWVYEHEGRVVANCHKLPSRLFTRRRLTVEASSEEGGGPAPSPTGEGGLGAGALRAHVRPGPHHRRLPHLGRLREPLRRGRDRRLHAHDGAHGPERLHRR